MSKHDDSLCWKCIHSAAPVELQCSWDRTSTKEPVKGAEVKWVIKGKNNGKNICVGIVRSCPEFETIYNLSNLKKLEEAKKNAKEKEYASLGLQQSYFHRKGLPADGV